MNRYTTIVVLAFAALAPVSAVFGQRGEGPQWQREAAEFGWQFDYQKARKQAAELNKPLMVVFRCIP
ncbi:MAG: hypothetical protein ACI9HK_003979 [Pirellulaceae bacterium]|jgi:hypothetical protein